jgi:integrase/recombinase XerD
MVDKHPSFSAQCLPLSEWPEACRQAWENTHHAPELFDSPKPALAWRPATRTKVRKGFSAWLSWRIYYSLLDQSDGPDAGVTPEAVKAYYDTLTSTRAPLTAYCRIHELFLALRVMVPERDWTWLGRAANKARSSAQNARSKRDRMQTPARLQDLAHTLMDEAETNSDLSDFKRALMFRDGVLILFLIHRPVRLRNIAALTLGTHIVFEGNNASLAIPAAEMKSHRPYETTLPSDLIDVLQRYCVHYRPFLLQLTHEDDCETRQLNNAGLQQALWISSEGRRLDEASLRNAIRKRTKHAFGIDITPHLFRDAAVTAIIRHSPEAALMTKDILGHATIATTERHYNQALMIDASRQHADLIESLLAGSNNIITDDVVISVDIAAVDCADMPLSNMHRINKPHASKSQTNASLTNPHPQGAL